MVDRDQLTGWAAFDMPTFLSLPSSRWFIIKANENLFLPGNLAHKVITLEPYMELAGFMSPCRVISGASSGWILYDTLDINRRTYLAGLTGCL